MYREITFNKNIKKICEGRGNRAKLAKEIGVHKEAVAQWIKDNRLPNLFNVTLIADYLGVTLDELVYGDLEGFPADIKLVADGKQYNCPRCGAYAGNEKNGYKWGLRKYCSECGTKMVFR